MRVFTNHSTQCIKKSVLASAIVAVLTLSACQNNTTQSANVIPTYNDKSTLAKTLTPYHQRDVKDDVFYFVLPDRFSNGDKTNDMGAAASDQKRALSRGGLDVTNKGMYHGGDLKGLINKLPYLDQMGISAIWLTPMFRNQAVQANTAAYHGYWILDFTEIDPHFGSNQELKDLIRLAHQRNIKIFFDIIVNHTADVIKYKECHGDNG